MKIEELFKKAEDFFALKPDVEEKKKKLENKFIEKIILLKLKIKNKKNKKIKKTLIKKLRMLKKLLKKLNDM